MCIRDRFWWGAHPSFWLALGVGVFFLASAAYVLSRPSPKPLDPAEQSAAQPNDPAPRA